MSCTCFLNAPCSYCTSLIVCDECGEFFSEDQVIADDKLALCLDCYEDTPEPVKLSIQPFKVPALPAPCWDTRPIDAEEAMKAIRDLSRGN